MSFPQGLTNSGDTTIQTSQTITPQDANDFALFITNSNGCTTPVGWTEIEGGVFSLTSSGAAPLLVTTNNAGPGVSQWANVIATFTTTATPTQLQTASFGSGGVGVGPHPVSFGSNVNANDTVFVIVQANGFGIPTDPPTVTDSHGNTYIAFGINNSVGNEPDYTGGAWLFVAFAVGAGPLTVTLTLPANQGNLSGGEMYTYSGIAPIPPGLSFQAAPDSIRLGQSSTLTWVVSGADSGGIDNGIGEVPLSGSMIVTPQETTFYHLNAYDNGQGLFFPGLTSSGFTDLGTSLAIKVAAATFGGEIGTAFSVTLAAGTSQGLTISAAAILETAAFDTSVTNSAVITFNGGATSYTIPEGDTVTSDLIGFAFDNAHDYYIVIYTNNNSNLGIAYGSASGVPSNLTVSSQSSGNNTIATDVSFFTQDFTFWRVFQSMNVVLTQTGQPVATAVAEVEVLSNEASFALQKIILTLKQDRIPVRGRNGGGR